MKRRYLAIVSAVFAAALVLSCAGAPQAAAPKSDEPFQLALFHVNDTHAKLDPLLVEFKVDIDPALAGKRTFIELGGFPQLWSAVDQLRAQYKNSLFLHAGDVFQGTLYFTQFEGKADLDFLNAMKLDAMTLGNHEFDKGNATLASFGAAASFPIVSANIDFSADKDLAKIVKPYVIKEIGGQKVGIIGVTSQLILEFSNPRLLGSICQSSMKIATTMDV